MAPSVVAIVLCGALLHAGWNALVKGGRDPFLSSVLVASGAALLSLPILPFLTPPASASWPYALASTAIHYALSQTKRSFHHQAATLFKPILNTCTSLAQVLF